MQEDKKESCMLVITDSEIREIMKDAFSVSGNQIYGKHGCFNGEKDFVLCEIEQIMGLLEQDKIDDEKVIIYTKDLYCMSKENNNVYEKFLKAISFDAEDYENGVNGSTRNLLSTQERRILDEMAGSNYFEYLMKGEYQSCCYSAMKVFLITMYCLLQKNIQFHIYKIEMIVDIDDSLIAINVFEGEEDTIPIIVDWHSTNKINSIYMLYKTQYMGLEKETILDLVSADVIEEDYYLQDERFTIAPSLLVKQYCAIIEHEINALIQLLNYSDKPNGHLMWGNMKAYVKQHQIKISCITEDLDDILTDLHPLRNKAMHGEVISSEEYKIVQKYKVSLFTGISQEKLMLKNKKIGPSIEEIGKIIKY